MKAKGANHIWIVVANIGEIAPAKRREN